MSESQYAVLNAVVDELVPGGEGFPEPSSTDLVDFFFTRYVTADRDEVLRFPYARESEFKDAVNRLGRDILEASRARRTEVLRRLEREEPEFFGQLRTLTYAGYYSRPEVVGAIRKNLEAGRDYHGPPLPYGYGRETADWSDEVPPAGAGTYIATEEVSRAV